uniref:type II secretion system F family protein n=1 Tax=uncultured Sphingomonas sp. TaxID=158754 RepID=UPI0025CFD162|nr:type II secretion system F family protein [uncultured Sphingomonas sp.]
MHDNLLGFVVFLLVFACIVAAIMVARGDSDTRRLEGRIRSLQEGAIAPGADGPAKPARNIRRAGGGSPLARALEKLGRSRYIPSDRRVAWPVVAAIGLCGGAAATYVGSKVFSSAAAPAVGVVAALFFVRMVFRWETSRYQTKLFQQLPDAMGLILRAIRAGLPMGESLANVARELPSPSREEFGQVVSNIAIGQATDAALFGLAERSGLTEYYFFAVTVGLQAQTGGNLGETIDNLADMVRKRVAMVARVKALTGEARISAIILSALPFCVGGLISLLKPGHLDPLFTSDLGFRLLLIGSTMLGIGLLIIRGLVKGAVKD